VQGEKQLEVRIAKEGQRGRETHILSSKMGAMGQHSEGAPASDEHSLSFERRRTDKSAQKKESE